MLRSVKRFEEGVARWRADMLIVKRELVPYATRIFLHWRTTAINDQFVRLDEFIEHVDNEVESERLALEQSRFSNRQVIATIMKRSSDNAHFTKKILKRLYEAGVAQHNARVDFYHFLLAQRAEQSGLPGRPGLRQCGRSDRRPPQTCPLIVPVRITRTKGFLKAYAKLTSDVQDRVDIALRQFVANPASSGTALRKIQNLSYPARRSGPLAYRHS